MLRCIIDVLERIIEGISLIKKKKAKEELLDIVGAVHIVVIVSSSGQTFLSL